jgi:hypothetical protein
MLRAVTVAVFMALASAAASAATAPAGSAVESGCEPGRLAAPGEIAIACEAEGDVTALAAELLVVKFGRGAPQFAAVRARRYAAEDDSRSAEFWQTIAGRAEEMLKSRAANEEKPTILSK